MVSLTEGWIVGLQLAPLFIQDTVDTASIIQSFSGSHKFVFDYLAQEVLDRQPAIVQQFLLRTAVVDRFCSHLINAVLGDEFFRAGQDVVFSNSEDVLAYLERANLFVEPLDQQRKWYRYHHLFADFLRARLSQSVGEEQVAGLNSRASEWYERNGFYADAIHHTLAAKNYDNLSHTFPGTGYRFCFNRL